MIVQSTTQLPTLTHLTSIHDLTRTQIESIIEQAFAFKYGKVVDLQKKVVAMIFEKPSLRTKVAFEVAATKLNAIPVFLSSEQILASGQQQFGRESIPDIAKNLERMADLIVARVYSHDTIQHIVQSVNIPVINALCDMHHPTQALADIMAMQWHKGDVKKLKVAFVGDGNNVANSLMHICSKLGMEFSIASPPGYELVCSSPTRGVLHYTDPVAAVQNADVVYTDTYISMGQESESEERIEAFATYQVTAELMSQAKSDAVFMHCLPAHRGEEVTNEVMDSEQSIVFDQAECRLHIAKALLANMLEH